MLPIVNFKNIRTQGGTQNGGFEELIVQLLRNDLTNIKDFIRVNGAGGDGGVEAFGTLDNRSEIGVQAKYFFELGTSQWRQLSESVETALKKHPNLIEYRIAIPIDRTSTQLKKWEDKVKIWTEYAKQYGKPPIFKWWGASEIQGMLTTPSGLAKLQYWFGTPHFTQEWLNECNNGMIRSLDCRYTPRHHVKTESERILEAFCQHPSFASIYKKKSESLVLSFLEIGDFEIQDQKAQHAWNELKIAWLILREYIGNGTQSVPFQKLGIECLKNLTCVSNLQRVLRELKQKYKKKSEHDFTDPYSSSTHELSKFYQSLNEYHEFLQHYACVDHQFLLVFGEAGSGKSHLLASIIETCKRRGQAALFLLGECFTTSELPDQQLIKLTHWQGNIDGLLSVLNEKSVIDGSPSLICIDALNENHARILWKTHLLNFSHLISKYPNIRLIVSCRTDFSNATLPDSIRDRKEGQWSYIDHEGFGVDIFKAVETYFKNYSIQSDYFPPLLTEFSNPLFLKTLCEAYEGMRLESGHLTLKNVFETRIYRLCEKLLADIDCPKYITRKAIDLIADEMAKNRTARLSMMSVRKQIDDLFPNQGDSRSLYTRLRSEGLLAEVGSNQDGELYVRFQFERFFDYFSAERMLNTAKNEGELRSQWESSGFINKLGDTTYVYQNSGLIRMLAILLPEIFGIELAELWPKNLNLTYKFDAFISSIQWRGSSSFSEKSDRLILHVLNHSECEYWLSWLLPICGVPKHRYNADFLFKLLNKLELNVREKLWTVPITWPFTIIPTRIRNS